MRPFLPSLIIAAICFASIGSASTASGAEPLNANSASNQDLPHLLELRTRRYGDWRVGSFLNTHTDKPFFALESIDADPLMRIVHYPHSGYDFVEFIMSEPARMGRRKKLELRFEHNSDEPFSLYIDADLEDVGYSFDLPQHPDDRRLFWAAFTGATDLTVFDGYSMEIGRFSLNGSAKAHDAFENLIGR